MKRTLAFLLLALLAAATGAQAQAPAAPRSLGLGIVAGEPTGLSFKTWLDESQAIDAAAAWAFAGRGSFQLHADYLVHVDLGLGGEYETSAPFYYGIGARVRDEGGGRDHDGTHLGVRVPLGIAIFPSGAPPLELFIEIAPGLDLAPSTDLFMNGGIGVRYYLR